MLRHCQLRLAAMKLISVASASVMLPLSMLLLLYLVPADALITARSGTSHQSNAEEKALEEASDTLQKVQMGSKKKDASSRDPQDYQKPQDYQNQQQGQESSDYQKTQDPNGHLYTEVVEACFGDEIDKYP